MILFTIITLLVNAPASEDSRLAWLASTLRKLKNQGKLVANSQNGRSRRWELV